MHRKPLSKRQAAAAELAKRRRTVRRAVAVSLAVLLVAGLGLTAYLLRDEIALARSRRGLVQLTEVSEDVYFGKNGKLSYTVASLSFEPARTGDAYAFIETKKADRILYRLDTTDPTLYLADEYTGTGTTLFVRTGTDLPSPLTHTPVTVRICDSSYGTPAEIYHLTDAAVIGAMLDAFRTGEGLQIPFDTYERKLDLKCVFEGYEAIYYNLFYLDCPDGGYIYDKATRHCVFIGDMMDDYTR